MTDLFINGRFMGEAKNTEKLIAAIKEARRKGQISEQVNVAYHKQHDTLVVLTDAGRARRPVIVVENGKPKLTKEHMDSIKDKKMKWSDLINQGIIEYLDTEEEENAYIALKPEDLTSEHTHLELDPTIILGLATSMVPFTEFDRGDRVNFGGKMIGQSIGIYATNFPVRVDTKANILIHPQVPIIRTHVNDVVNDDSHPGGQNVTLAVMSFMGYNMEDAVIINKSSIERGIFWSYLFRTYEAEEKRYLGGQEDMIGIPEPGVRGYPGEDAYKHLSEDGIADPETYLEAGEIIIAKTSPLRFLGGLDQFITGLENIRETSVKLRHGERGIVDRVFVTESNEGNKLVKVVIRDLKRPELGDKFASRHGQKGVVGLTVPQEDMPFTEEGVVPDVIFNPHGIPSRMTIGQLLETIAGKVAALTGKKLSSPAFHPLSEKELRKTLVDFGFNDNGTETMFDGRNGRQFYNPIFIGNIYYQKLDHLVSNKIYARSKGPVTLLTKQPTEGKSKMGGLRLGEMEKDCLIAHGASLLLKERFDSDKTFIPMCKDCGMDAIHDRIKNKKLCPACGGTKIIDVEMSYAFKLLLDELKSMLIYPKIIIDEEMSSIDKIAFGVLNPDTIKKMSISKISKTELYDQEGYPVEGGLMDPRLGVIDPGLRCRTCAGTVGDCKGHFGYMELTKPVIHVNYAKLIFNILKSTCRKCGRVLLSQEEMEKFKKTKKSMKKIKQMIKTACTHCKEKQRKIKFIKPTTYMENSSMLTPIEIREWFEKIPDSDLPYLGMRRARPEHLVITMLPIPPVTVRPSITLETGERSEDDLTHKLVDVVRINKRLRENTDLGAPDFIIQDLWELLQYHVATYMNNEISGVPPARHRSGRILKTLAQRLKTKEGRFRSNLIGKRVNYSARTVISPDPMLDINEVGIPMFVVKELTVPIVVSDSNAKKIKEMIERYPQWPTINYVSRPDGRRKKVTETNKEEIAKEIEPGFIVEKQVEDGDWSIFNRQPSLHKMSMMGHKIRVMPYNTFRFNLAVTAPYNADFDGDEMNLHVPQTKEAQTETKLLTDVTTQIRSPRFSGPIIGAINDYITGTYILTDKLSIPREDAVDIVRSCDLNAEIPNKKEFTGKEIFSFFLPKDFNFTYDVGGDKVIIKNGKIIEGIVDEYGVGVFKGKILDELERKYGYEFTRQFLFCITKLSLATLMRVGFTTSISDYDLDPRVINRIYNMIEDSQKEVDRMISDFRKGKTVTLVGRTKRESLELGVRKRMADLLNEISDAVGKSIPETPTVIMAKSGARGSLVNMVQCAACIGQETVKGERIKIGYFKRTFPHFKRGDISLESRGFVRHGYKDGLSPFEFYYDAMNSREGLMDKSLKTRHSGYLERRLIGALKDLKVEYDRTVRDADKKIIQFVAGEDGLDPAKIQKGGINVERIAENIFGK